ncbi:MAG: hypothetical protein LBT46_08690, partial [Planctomycetaceae bacterium]|nr:hypothetical protein [Planctomycetaceae bacterium]
TRFPAQLTAAVTQVTCKIVFYREDAKDTKKRRKWNIRYVRRLPDTDKQTVKYFVVFLLNIIPFVQITLAELGSEKMSLRSSRLRD